ncbi:20S proteasome alpha subunit 2 [Spironucleus salmonicida]|uniref:20S proteasome alpha subunit 2 n=1 Tax=Spironucleus salmonicida TaxID=348837 RepID=V6LVH7_9EUKA|nr:20S proteasome alpha subunit 2 [Spironucleus salmonicida]|eukprot:EST47686.1 Proteasome subunit alpha type [Spironucleus salmonicida]
MEELGYSFSLTTFSPTGQLWQIQHAIAATNRGRLSVSVQTPQGSVLLVQRKTDEASEKLIDQSSLRLISKISSKIAIACSGLSGDTRSVVSAARLSAIEFSATYGTEPTAFEVVNKLSKIFQEKTRAGGVRPYGVCCVVADFNQCFQINPSGSFYEVKAWANGNESEAARQILEKRGDSETLGDGIVLCLSVAKEVCQVELNKGDFQVCVVDKEGFRMITQEEIDGYWAGVE